MWMYSFFSGLRLKLLYNKKRKSQPNIPFYKAQKIGILIQWHKEMKAENITLFISNLKDAHKEVKVLIYSDKVLEPIPLTEAIWFYKKELSWLGTILNSSVKRFIASDFDYLYVITDKPSSPVEFILARCKAKTVIGKNIEALNPYQDMIITLEKNSTLETLLHNMYHYSEQLR